MNSENKIQVFDELKSQNLQIMADENCQIPRYVMAKLSPCMLQDH